MMVRMFFHVPEPSLRREKSHTGGCVCVKAGAVPQTGPHRYTNSKQQLKQRPPCQACPGGQESRHKHAITRDCRRTHKLLIHGDADEAWNVGFDWSAPRSAFTEVWFPRTAQPAQCLPKHPHPPYNLLTPRDTRRAVWSLSAPPRWRDVSPPVIHYLPLMGFFCFPLCKNWVGGGRMWWMWEG